MRTLFYAFVSLGAPFIARDVEGLQCRVIVRGTLIETRYPNGAVSVGRVEEGETFVIINCTPEGRQVWCNIQETGRPVFTVRRFLEADRLDRLHSEVVDFSRCLASGN